MFDFVSNDVAAFLIGWYRIFYEKGIRVALAEDIGDYTPAYMYVLGFISLFRPAPESLSFVHALKYVSCLFDYVSAIFVLLLCLNRLRTEKWVALIGYTTALFLPTILLNSAFWGQCDSIFTAFCVASLYYLSGNHQRTGLILYGCAFAFKLQSVFLLPFLVYLVLVKRLKLRFFLYIPLVYLLFALPSAICGRDFLQILIIYGNQWGFLSVSCAQRTLSVCLLLRQHEQRKGDRQLLDSLFCLCRTFSHRSFDACSLSKKERTGFL